MEAMRRSLSPVSAARGVAQRVIGSHMLLCMAGQPVDGVPSAAVLTWTMEADTGAPDEVTI
jgi:hypothetical protein